MKKRISLLVLFIVVCSSFTALAAPTVSQTKKTAPKIISKTSAVVIPTLPVVAPNKGKQIEAWFYNIKLLINGQSVVSTLEPFIYADNVYVPLKPIVEGFGGTFNWDTSTKTITIQDNIQTELTTLKNKMPAIDFQVNSAQAQLSIKDDKIKDLEKQVSNLEKKISDLKDDNNRHSSSSNSYSDIRKTLENNYDRYNDSTSGRMIFTYNVDKIGGTIEVEMKGDFSTSDDTWKKRSSSGFKDFVESVARKVRRDTDYDIKVTARDKNNNRLATSE